MTSHAITSCEHFGQLLPWALNGSLEAKELDELRDHLGACSDCSEVLSGTLAVQRVAESHVPSLDLANYVLGVESTGLDRRLLETHLANCSSCQEEIAMISQDIVTPFDAEPRRQHEPETYREPSLLLRAAMLAGVVLAVSAVSEFLGWDLDGHRGETETVIAQGLSGGVGFDEPESDRTSLSSVLFMDGFEMGTTEAWVTGSEENTEE